MSDSAHANRTSIERALDEEEDRLRRLDADRADTKARAEALRAQLAAIEPAVVRGESLAVGTMAPRSPTEKVKLFRQLFRGRDDLYPTRFVRKKTDKAGYAPACANKFVVGLCELPKVPESALLLNRLHVGFLSVLARLDVRADYAAEQRTFLTRLEDVEPPTFA